MLIIGNKVVEELKTQAQKGHPYEICGLFLGEQQGPSKRIVSEVRQVENICKERARDRYNLSSTEYAKIEKEGISLGLKIVGVYHSHPDHPSIPSETDRKQAERVWGQTESWSYIILEVNEQKVVSWHSWILKEAVFEEEEIEVEQ